MDKSIIIKEIKFKAIRSSGSGGQHVNKVSTKVELSFDIKNSQAFRDDEKSRIESKLKNQISKEGFIIIQSQDSRSQLKNKKMAKKKLIDLLTSALIVPKKRKKTLPSKKVREKRLQSKRINAEKKSNRRKPIL